MQEYRQTYKPAKKGKFLFAMGFAIMFFSSGMIAYGLLLALS